jgi:iron complex outermembrane receptor protein
VKSSQVSVNVTNLTNKKGVSTVVVTSASGGYQAFPIAPRMVFVTLQAGF